MTPSWILDIFAAIMLAVAAVSVGRLAAARPWQQGTQAVLADTDVSHLLMGVAMAGMLTASLKTLPDDAWAIIFGALTAWFAYRVIRDAQVSGVRALAGGHCAPHLIHAAAMLYMFVAFTAPAAPAAPVASGMGGMSGMGTLQVSFLAFVFALLLIGYSIWDLDQLSGPGASGHYSLARTAPAAAVLVGATAGTGSTAAASGSAGSAAVAGVQPIDASVPATRTGHAVLAPWVASSCRIAMGVTMAFMLLIMI